MTDRSDIHRPSAIVPADYEFVAYDYIGPNSSDVGSIESDRRAFRVHMARTGGKFSGHDHGGTCHVCGATALYTAIFYHPNTNTYIRTGEDCAEKVALGNPKLFRAFRERVRSGIEAVAGKRKAERYLADANLTRAWEIYTSPAERDGEPLPKEENIICDIVSRLVQYGSLFPKQVDFLRKLLVQIDQRTERNAQRAAEAAAAEPVPVTTGRTKVEGVVLSIKLPDESSVFPQRKMLIKTPAGYKLYGSIPSNLSVERGDTVTFEAKIERSKDDEKFGFWSRPTKAEIKTLSTDPQTVAGRAIDKVS